MSALYLEAYLEARVAIAAPLSVLTTGLGGAAADRQYRLGRYVLDLFAGAGRHRKRLVAGRGCPPNARHWCYRDCQLHTSPLFPQPLPA